MAARASLRKASQGSGMHIRTAHQRRRALTRRYSDGAEWVAGLAPSLRTTLLIVASSILNACGGGSDAPPATHFSVTSAASGVVLAGAPLGVTVTALDANNRVVTAFGASIRLTSTDPAASMPAQAALRNGIANIQVTF